MKTLFLLMACVCHFVLDAQTTIGFKVGISPDVNPGTAPHIINRSDRGKELLFNSTHVKYTPSAGALLRIDRKQFWFSAEVLGFGLTETYSVQDINDRRPGTERSLKEKSYVIEVPLSAGVSLG